MLLSSRLVRSTESSLGGGVSTHPCVRRLAARIPRPAERAYAPVALITTLSLEVERRVVQLVRALHRRERDREVLDREACRVEARDLVRRLTAPCESCEHRAQLGHLCSSDRASL